MNARKFFGSRLPWSFGRIIAAEKISPNSKSRLSNFRPEKCNLFRKRGSQAFDKLSLILRKKVLDLAKINAYSGYFLMSSFTL